MRRIVLDTNVLVSFLTDRNAEQQAQAAALFESAARAEAELMLHQTVIGEMVYVLRNLYRVERRDIARTLDDLLSTAGVTPVDEVIWSRVLALWPGAFPDFADAVLAAVTAQQRYDAVATFDQRFIRRLRRAGLAHYWPVETAVVGEPATGSEPEETDGEDRTHDTTEHGDGPG